MSIKIWPWNYGSRGARALTNALENSGVRCRRLMAEGTYVQRSNDTIINWGNFRLTDRIFSDNNIINPPSVVSVANNKLLHMMSIRDSVYCIPHTVSRAVAQQKVNEGSTMVCRHVLSGHSGEGIEIIHSGDTVPQSRLYTQYVNKLAEYRVHLIRDGLRGYNHLIQQKRRNLNYSDPNWYVRNHENGFIYSVNDVELPDVDLVSVAKEAMCGLDFGAVDIIIANNSQYNIDMGIDAGNPYILEVNTACGIQSDTVKEFYGESLKELLENEY